MLFREWGSYYGVLAPETYKLWLAEIATKFRQAAAQNSPDSGALRQFFGTYFRHDGVTAMDSDKAVTDFLAEQKPFPGHYVPGCGH